MKKLFEIIIENSVDVSYLNIKINELGNAYRLYQNKFFLFADFNSAQELYERIITEDYQQTGIVILEIPLKGFSFWGYSEKSLWAWLSFVETDYLSSEIDCGLKSDENINMLRYQIETLKKENLELRSKLKKQ